MTFVTGRGPWPGADVLRAQLDVFEDFSSTPYGVHALPYLVQLDRRGPGADLMGRTLALLDGLPTELGPHGWKLASHGGRDMERAQSFLDQDLEALSIAGTGYTGGLCVDLMGPWTLAAQLYLNAGDRVLTDPGAVTDLAHGLTEAALRHVGQITERLPGATVTVRFDESLLAQVGAGVLPTFSGYSRMPLVPGPKLVEVLKPLITRVNEVSTTVINVGQSFGAIAPVVLSGANHLGMEFSHETPWQERGWELIARAHEKGVHLWAGLPAAHFSKCSGTNLLGLCELVTLGWSRVGLAEKDLDLVTITQSKPGAQAASLAGPKAVRANLANLTLAAEHLAERAAQ